MALIPVPLTGQSLNQTRAPIFTNFQTINAAFLVDHIVYGAAGQGKHNQVTFPTHTGGFAFVNPEIGLYNFVNPISTTNELYIRKSDGTLVPSTLTANNAGGAFQTSGYTYLPSGLLVKWGSFTNASVNANTHVRVLKQFPAAATIPIFNPVNGIYSVQLSLGNDTNPGQAWQALVTLDRFNSTNIALSIDINNQSAFNATGNLLIYYYVVGIGV